MKIFISWSGERSKAIAKALNDFLPKIIQAVKPFYSPEIEKGATWSNKIDDALAGTTFGIVCLTSDNLDSKWIHFESGALFKTLDSRIWTFLTGIEPKDVLPPLSKFQHTIAEKAETFAMVQAINAHLKDIGGEPVNEALLSTIFEAFWESFKSELDKAEAISTKKSAPNKPPDDVRRGENDILGEILEIVRDQQRQLSNFEERLGNSVPSIKTTSESFTVRPVRRLGRLAQKLIGIEFAIDSSDKSYNRILKELKPYFEAVVDLGFTCNIKGTENNKFFITISSRSGFDQTVAGNLKKLFTEYCPNLVISELKEIDARTKNNELELEA